MEKYQGRQGERRHFVGARSQEFRFARYIEDWRQKIEAYAARHYPPEAKGIYGTLGLTVSIRADGSVDAVEIVRPSGSGVLDAAAERLVRAAAPFEPFPPEIARDTDILSITRTWIFTRTDSLSSP